MAFVDKALWPRTEAFSVRRESGSDGECFLLVGEHWPEHIEVADELFENADALA